MLAQKSTTPKSAPMPAPPERNFSFTDWQTNNPTAPPPGDKLDSNFDATNLSVEQVIDWASISLNTDGSLRDGIVGQSNLVAGLFDGLSQDIIDDVQPLVDEANSYAQAAQVSATNASGAASSAATSASGASNSAGNASASASAAAGSQAGAQAAQTAAVNANTSAQNAASNAIGAEGAASDYAVAAQAWAEHMPDTIPPNILAVMGVTGAHWSSRWWANQANIQVSDALQQINDALNAALGQIQTATNNALASVNAAVDARIKYWYLGALPADPAPATPPYVTGCLYFNTTTGSLMVWNGTAWQPATGVSLGVMTEYQYKPAAGITVLSGPDLHSNSLVVNPLSDTTSVWKGGTRIFKGTDYTVQTNQITLMAAADGNTTYTVDVTESSAAMPAVLTSKLNLSSWAPNGSTTTFPLKDATNANLVPKQASDVLFSIDGVWLEAGKDYTVSGSNITFTAAPANDSDMFGVLGVPVGG